MSHVKCVACIALITFALIAASSSQTRAQSAEDECAKVAATAPYAGQKKAYDQCMAEKAKKK